MLERAQSSMTTMFDRFNDECSSPEPGRSPEPDGVQSCAVDALFDPEVTHKKGGRDCSLATPPPAKPAGHANQPENMFAIAHSKVGLSKESMRNLDCSGFVKWTARQSGLNLDKAIDTTKGSNGCSQMLGSFQKVPEKEVKTGDLVFFKIDDDPKKAASHVGILCVHDDGTKTIIHMTNHGVKESRLDDIAVAGTKITWGSRIIPGGYARIPAQG